MGHIHLATLPSAKRWREVVEQLNDRAGAPAIFAASARAAEKDLAVAATDPSLAAAVRLLALIPLAARSDDFGGRLRKIGIAVPDQPLLGDLAVGVASAFERRAPVGPGTDFAEIVRRALVGNLAAELGDALPGLFEADAGAVQRAAAEFAQPEGFSRTARAFFGRLHADTLGSWLDRTLSAEVGAGARIASLAARDAFDRALARHCADATRIIREFSVAWYVKTLSREGTISIDRASAFSAIAMEKIGGQLQRQRLRRA